MSAQPKRYCLACAIGLRLRLKREGMCFGTCDECGRRHVVGEVA